MVAICVYISSPNKKWVAPKCSSCFASIKRREDSSIYASACWRHKGHRHFIKSASCSGSILCADAEETQARHLKREVRATGEAERRREQEHVVTEAGSVQRSPGQGLKPESEDVLKLLDGGFIKLVPLLMMQMVLLPKLT